MVGFRLRRGTVIGRDHRLSGRNNQDALLTAEINGNLIGVVCDGCGSGAASEVGARLLAAALVHRARQVVMAGVAVDALPPLLMAHAQITLATLCDTLLDAPTSDERAAFVGDYLLATVLGCVIGPEQSVVFAAGDGVIAINDAVYIRDEGNQPHYLSYGLLEAAQPTFDVWTFDTSELRRLALWTDGLTPDLLDQMWGVRHPNGLQRRLNVLARDGHCADDTSGIVIEREAYDECSDR